MNRIATTPRGFPFDERSLLEIQEQTVPVLNAIAQLIPDNSRVWGVEGPGFESQSSEISDGFILWNGEFLPFVGGPVSAEFSIVEEVVTRAFNIGTDQDPQLEDHPAYIKRYATPGIIPGAESWHNLAQLREAPKFLTELGSGEVFIGTVTPMMGDSTNGEGTVIDVVFPERLSTINYLIFGTFYKHNNSAQGSFNHDIFDRKNTGFKVRIKDVTDVVNDLFFDYVIIPM